MKTETARQKIADMIDGKPVKFRDGGQHALISEKQQSLIFNILHRDYSIHRMNLKRIDAHTVHILASDWEGSALIDCNVTTY